MENIRSWAAAVTLAALGAVLLPLLPSGGARAQGDAASYPSRPIRLVIPFLPGGSTDVLGRKVGEILSKELGSPFVIVNTAGAGGVIGATEVARSTPNGYTLLIGTPGTISINPQLQKEVRYDPIKDFVAICLIWSQPSIVIVNRKSKFTSLRELMEEARRNPGKLNFGSAGVGSFNHLSGELFMYLTGVKMTHIPYKGASQSMTDLMAGTLDANFSTVAGYTAVKEQLAGLAITATSRSPFAPEVPTTAEAGLPEYIFNSWGGLLAPAGTPAPIREKLAAAMSKSLAQEGVRERFGALGVDPSFSTPAEFQKHIAAEVALMRKLITAAGLKQQ